MHGPLSTARLFLVLSVLVAAFVALPSAASAGTIVADNGFRPDPDGFSFPNYGNEGQKGLDAAEFERLYGPGVCLPGKGACVLTPLARTVMKSYNEGSADGHCFGFATLSELIYKGLPAALRLLERERFRPRRANPFALDIEGNDLLQRSITRAFDFQNLESINENTIVATPTEILNFLLHGGLDPKSKEIWTFEIFQYGFKAGHAITPVRGRKSRPRRIRSPRLRQQLARQRRPPPADQHEHRHLELLRDGVPGLPAGDVRRQREVPEPAPRAGHPGPRRPALPVLRRSPGRRLEVQPGPPRRHLERTRPPLIETRRAARPASSAASSSTRSPARRSCRAAPAGIRLQHKTLWKDSPAPVVEVPKDVEFDVNIDGKHLGVRDRETLSLVGPTYDATVENLIMAPHQEAHVALSPKGNAITYLPSAKTVSPAITLGAESKSAAYNVTVAALGAPKGSSLTFVKVPKQQLMWFGDDTKAKRTYGVKIKRYDLKAEPQFGRQVTISGNQQAFLYYGPLGKPNGRAKIVVYTPGHRNHPVKEMPIEVVG